MYRPYRAVFVPTALWCDLCPVEWLLRKMQQNIFMQTAVWLVSRELTERAGPWDTGLSTNDDGEYFCRVLLESENVKFVRDARVLYRMSGCNRLSHIGLSPTKQESDFRSIRLQIGHLRAREDSERVRRACLNQLRTSLSLTPARTDIACLAVQLAAELGGELHLPTSLLSRKYSLVETLCGLGTAIRVQAFVRLLKCSAARRVDRMRYGFDRLASSYLNDRRTYAVESRDCQTFKTGHEG
jgi:hypothetical protein